MSIYRRSRKDKAGKVVRAARYTAEFRFHGKLYRRGGFTDRDHAKHWMMSEQLKLRRGETGYVKPMRNAKVMPLIAEFIDYLRGKGNDDEYCYIAQTRLKRLAGEAGWVTLGHMTAASLEVWKGQPSYWANRPKQPISNRTKNQFVRIAQEFGAWLVKPSGKLPSNPLADVETLRAKHNDAYRRAATVEELNKLLATCPKERRLAYLFRLYTGLRSGTIEQLTWRMLHLDANPPYGLTPATINKSRRDEKFGIRLDVAQEMRAFRRDSRSRGDDRVFQTLPTLDDLRDDLQAAKVAFDDGQGNRRLDFHSFRRTLIRLGKAQGVSVDQLSLLLGHRDPRTTRRHYDEDTINPQIGDALERLPTIGKVRTA